MAAGLPTAVTLACDDKALGEKLRGRINLPHFRTYLTDDVCGAEVGGAVKNVLAIACGVAEGRRLGQNARAALIARGFAEMVRFGMSMGGRRETLAGLSGLGRCHCPGVRGDRTWSALPHHRGSRPDHRCQPQRLLERLG